jgi:cytochrome oxidase Cu insertion factor (SCO1/SenC/PrrC family)
LPASWRWAIGPPAAFASVWRAYGVGVRVTHRTIVGVRVRRVAHTEAAFVVDAAGYQRAVFVYPFSAADVERELDIAG